MRTYRNVFLAVLCLVATLNAGAQAQKKVTYGKSTFTVYQELPELLPTPPAGFAPPVPGYTLKSKDYGPGTYYVYAPGKVPKTSYSCILTEIRDWIFYRPDDVKKLAAERGLKLLDQKTIDRMFKNTRLLGSGLMYALSDTSWILLNVTVLRNSGPVAWGGKEEYVSSVLYIELLPQKTDVVLDRLYRFWNDGVRFAEFAGVTQSNFKTQPSAPASLTPNYFAIGDVLNPAKGFYSLSFAGGAPTYLWHSYDKVVAANLKKADFDASGEAGYEDIFSAFSYALDMVKTGKSLYVSYRVDSMFISDLQPGVTWQKEMASRKEQYTQGREAIRQTQKANEAAMEQMYKEIFK